MPNDRRFPDFLVEYLNNHLIKIWKTIRTKQTNH
jgi:hypothetical protein